MQEYPKSDEDDKILSAKASALLAADDAMKRYLTELNWEILHKDRQKIKEILSDAILKRRLDVAKKAIDVLEFDAQTQAADDADIIPKIVASVNLDLFINYVKKIASKEKY